MDRLEQLFSATGQMDSDRCSNLLGENAEKLLFLLNFNILTTYVKVCIAFIYSINYWLQFISAYTGVVYLIVFRIFTSPRQRLRSIVMSMSVCPIGYPRNHTRDLYQFFVHDAYVRGSDLLWHADNRPHRLSARRGWRECIARAKCNLWLPCYNFIFVLHHLRIRIIIHY